MVTDPTTNQVDASRALALDQAIKSYGQNPVPPGDDAILTRAKKFYDFLEPDD